MMILGIAYIQEVLQSLHCNCLYLYNKVINGNYLIIMALITYLATGTNLKGGLQELEQGQVLALSP